MSSKAFIKPIATEQQLPTLLEAINIIHKLSYAHHMATTYHGTINNERAKYWYVKAQTFLNNHLILQNMPQDQQHQIKYSVHNTTIDSYLTPNPNGLQSSYIFSLEKDKIVWFDNQLYTEVMAERYNEMYPEFKFKVITNNGS